MLELLLVGKCITISTMNTTGTTTSDGFVSTRNVPVEWLMICCWRLCLAKAMLITPNAFCSTGLINFLLNFVANCPSSWSQICVKAVNSNGVDKSKPKGVVIGIDKLQIYPVEGATFLGNTDFSSSIAQEKIKTLLNGRLVNVVLSDMAPNASGIRSLDQDSIMDLAFSVFNFAQQVSAPNASLLIKVWDNGDSHKFEKAIGQVYETCRVVKPPASRSDSAEKFILAKGFKKI